MVPICLVGAEPKQTFLINETGPVAQATNRLKILDAKYKKADLDEIVQASIHLDKHQQKKPIKLIKNILIYLMAN